MPVWRAVVEPYFDGPPERFLWDLQADPDQQHNLADQRTDQCDRLRSALRDQLRAVGAPEEQFARLGL